MRSKAGTDQGKATAKEPAYAGRAGGGGRGASAADWAGHHTSQQTTTRKDRQIQYEGAVEGG